MLKLKRRYWHKSLTDDAILKACTEDYGTGFCLACGAQADNVEPDAENYRCESCGADQVFGAEELLLAMF